MPGGSSRAAPRPIFSPPDNRVRLLVTRPEPEAASTAALLRARGHEVLTLPLLRIEVVATAELGAGPWAAALFTSASGVQAIKGHRRFREIVGLPAYVVGGRTRAAAMRAGFASVRSADGDVDDLVRLVVTSLPAPDLPLLYLAGSERAGDLEGGLRANGLRVETAVVYRSVMVADLRHDVRAALTAGQIDAVLHYSARTAAAYVTAIRGAGIKDSAINIRHLCLSAQVAAPLAEAGAVTIAVAAAPNQDALFDLIGPA
jgi:uroporphyrinogen-III synthase